MERNTIGNLRKRFDKNCRHRRQPRQRSRPTCKACRLGIQTSERPTRKDISGTFLSFKMIDNDNANPFVCKFAR